VPAPAAAVALLEAGSAARASNAWVIGGARTRSGRPILANDMHLALRAPSLWYLAALHAPGFDVVGMTLPGAPYVVAGHNRAIAWGFTNAMVDDVDLFLEEVDPADSTRYRTPDGSAPFQVLSDTIRVRGADPVVLRWRHTRHGPVISDAQPRLGGMPVALRWASQDRARPLSAIRSFNMARDWASFRAAVAAFDNPHQNVVYADTAGHIGYAMGGRIPVRGAGAQRPPTLPVPGWTGEWDWQGYHDDAEHPAALDPPHGYVVTANNRQAAGDRADRISGDWETPFRATRIRQLVQGAAGVDAAAVHRMQLDVGDVAAARYAPRAAELAARLGSSAQATLLRDWDHFARADSRAAALFYVWYARLRPRLAETLYGDTAGYLPRPVVDRVLELGALPWDSVAGAAAWDSAAGAAWRDAVAIADGRTWGELHSLRVEHAMGSVPLLQRLFRLTIDGSAASGSTTTVNVLHHVGARFPITSMYGASQRHVVDMGAVDEAGGFILPTGQSGLPFERHYRDQFARWRRGGLWRVPLGREAARARVVQQLRLSPAEDE
jgi:penicillin amidase